MLMGEGIPHVWEDTFEDGMEEWEIKLEKKSAMQNWI